MRQWVMLGLATAAGAGWAVAQSQTDRREVERTVPAAREGIVRVRIPRGTVELRGWNRDHVQISATDITEADLRVSSEHGHVEIAVVDGGDAGVVRIGVPTGSSVDIETAEASIDADDIRGVLRLETTTGHIRVAGRPAGLVALSQSGDIAVGSPDVRGVFHSEHGVVRIDGAQLARTDRQPLRHRSAPDSVLRCRRDCTLGELSINVGHLVAQALEASALSLDALGHQIDGAAYGALDLSDFQWEGDFEDLEPALAALGASVSAWGATFERDMTAWAAAFEETVNEFAGDLHRRLAHLDDPRPHRHRPHRP